jgi:hypothetical protein
MVNWRLLSKSQRKAHKIFYILIRERGPGLAPGSPNSEQVVACSEFSESRGAMAWEFRNTRRQLERSWGEASNKILRQASKEYSENSQ